MMSFMLLCWGCNKISSPYQDDEDHEKQLEQIQKETSWMRRNFYKDVNPWFCSVECSIYSSNARYTEKYWDDFINRQILIKRLKLSVIGIILISLITILVWRFYG